MAIFIEEPFPPWPSKRPYKVYLTPSPRSTSLHTAWSSLVRLLPAFTTYKVDVRSEVRERFHLIFIGKDPVSSMNV